MKAIIFDLDGTLWDATHSLTRIWGEEMKKAGITRTLTHAHMLGGMGLGPEALAAHMVPELPPERRKPFFDHVTYIETLLIPQYGAELVPALRQTLEKLPYARMIASNCVDNYIEAFMAYAGVEDLICDFAHPGLTGLSKGGNVKLLMERNHIDEAILVGDTVLDAQAAQEAGVHFIHADYGFGEVPDAKWRITRFSDLPAVAAQIFSE